MKELNEQTLEEFLHEACEASYQRLLVSPTHIIVPLQSLRTAIKVLRGKGWHYRNTKRWRYLMKRGARK